MSLSRKKKKNFNYRSRSVGCTIAEILSKKSFEVRLMTQRSYSWKLLRFQKWFEY